MVYRSWIDSAWQDGRYAMRALARRPWRFAAAASMLGLAIGISAAMFTILDALILRPVPFKDPDQLAHLYMRNGPGGTSPALFREWKASPVFLGVESADWSTAVVTTDAGDVNRGYARVTPGIFDLLGGVTPVRGRLFDATDGTPGATDRVLVSEDVWRTLYRADPSIVGHRVTIRRRIPGHRRCVASRVPVSAMEHGDLARRSCRHARRRLRAIRPGRSKGRR